MGKTLRYLNSIRHGPKSMALPVGPLDAVAGVYLAHQTARDHVNETYDGVTCTVVVGRQGIDACFEAGSDLLDSVDSAMNKYNTMLAQAGLSGTELRPEPIRRATPNL